MYLCSAPKGKQDRCSVPRGNCRGELSHDWCPVSPLPQSASSPTPPPTSSLISLLSSYFAQILLSHLHTCSPIFMVWRHGGGREAGGLFPNTIITLLPAPYHVLGPVMGQNEGLGRLSLPSGSPRGSQSLLDSVGNTAGGEKKNKAVGNEGDPGACSRLQDWLGNPGVVRQVAGNFMVC